MGRVSNCDGKGIIEDRSCFLKCDTVLLFVTAGLFFVPFKLDAHLSRLQLADRHQPPALATDVTRFRERQARDKW
jgi:hypothetical protein